MQLGRGGSLQAGGLSAFQAILVAFGLWILLGLVSRALWVFVLVALALVLAAGLYPLVQWARRVRLPPNGWQVPVPVILLAIYLVGGVLFLALLYFVVPTLLGELQSLGANAPQIVTGLTSRLEQLARSVGYGGAVPSPSDIAGQIQPPVSGIAEALTTATAGLLTFLVQLFIVLVLAYLLVVKSDEIVRFFVDLFPSRHRPRVRQVTSRIGEKVGHWLLGQIAVATITGVLAGVGAAVLGLPYPVLFGVLTGLVDLAPAVGPTAMAVPAGLLGLSISPALGIGAAAYFLVLAQIDGNVLSPLITGRAVQVSPVIIVIAVPLGFALYGPVGGLLAVPAAASIKVVVDEVVLPWLRRVEGEPARRPSEEEAVEERAA